MITVDCSDLVSDFRRRLESGESFDSIFADLKYGVDEEVEEFVRRLLMLLAETTEETLMNYSRHNGLSTSSRQAKLFLHLLVDLQLTSVYESSIDPQRSCLQAGCSRSVELLSGTNGLPRLSRAIQL